MITDDDYNWPIPMSKFCDLFDLGNGAVRSAKNGLHFIEGRDYFKDEKGWKQIYLYKTGAIKILRITRTEKGTKYLRKHGTNISPKDEHLYLDIIKYAIQEFDNPEKNFKISTTNNNYKIDLYLKNAKLEIECDEHDHYGQEDLDELKKREKDIFEVLGCRFLRFNPNDIDFNVGDVINVIFCYIFNKSLDRKDPVDWFMEKRKRIIRKRPAMDDDLFD
jgi:very-short-patch-repair endonuclease